MKNTNRVLLWIILILGAITLIALWGGTSGSPNEEIKVGDTDKVELLEINEAAQAAQTKLATNLLLEVSDVEVIAIESNDWPNSCLGLEKEGELCAQVIVPGFAVTLGAGGEQYRFRTDADGTLVIQE